MDADHTVIPHGRVLVRGDEIVAVWRGRRPPRGVDVGEAKAVRAGPRDLLFPGLINLHAHPHYNPLHLWLPPAGDVTAGRPTGDEPYLDRYQWNSPQAPNPRPGPLQYQRLVANPQAVLNTRTGLGLLSESVKYAEVQALLGGETATQGSTPNAEADAVLARNIDRGGFGGQIAPPRVASIASFPDAQAAKLGEQLRAGVFNRRHRGCIFNRRKGVHFNRS